ncbi:putative HMG box protein, partial [Basidiobolus meristosporus CBS 931.73]
RPPNPFFLFRKDKQASVFAQHRGISNLEVSKVVGRMWKTASFQEKEYYQRLAEEFKKEHQEKYPNYKYSPAK